MSNELQKIDTNILQDYQTSYRPYYNYRTDYQTDAPSYYDYLGNLNKIFTSIIDSVNQQIDYVNAISNKDIKVADTETIKLLMEGDFKVDNQILLKGRLRTSSAIENRTYNERTFDIRNAVIIKEDGIYIRDYTEVIAFLSTLIKENKEIIEQHKKDIDQLNIEDQTLEDSITKANSDIKKLETSIDNILSNGELATNSDLESLQIDLETLKSKVNTINSQMLSGFQTITSYQNKNTGVIQSLAERIVALENK